MKKKVLITGITGQDGSFLTKYLLENNDLEIFGTSRNDNHKPFFKTEVEIPDSKKIIGTGSSKKKAQQNAAEKLIRILKI